MLKNHNFYFYLFCKYADGFIKLIRTIVPFVIFTTVVSGIYSLKNLKEAGRIGIKAIIYFEVMTTLAMILGLVVVSVVIWH